MVGPEVWEYAGGSVARSMRSRQILSILFEKGFATVEELVEELQVSRMTVHRDLDELQSRGALTKVRGGATAARTSSFESNWHFRRKEHLEAKEAIAQRALDYVEPGDSLVIDPSTTGHVFCQLLSEKAPLKVVTCSLPVITDLSNVPDIELHVIGGVYDPNFHCFMGTNAQEAAKRFRVDKIFMSTAALSGRTMFHSQERAISLDRQLFNSAREHILLCDSSKLSHTALHVFGDASEWQVIITDSNADPAALEELRDTGPQIDIVDIDPA